MSDQADSQPQQAAPDTTGSEAQAPDPIMARLDELASSISSLAPPAPEPEPEYGDYAFNESYQPDPAWDDPADEQAQPDPQAEQDAWAQINDTIARQVQQGIQQSVDPFLTAQKAAQLEAKYPDLKTPEVAQRVVQQAEHFAGMLAQSMGLNQQQAAKMARSPELIERLYLAERAQRQAGQETPANGGPEAHLEGASAQVAAPEVDFFDQIRDAGTGGPQGNRFGWT